MARSGPTRILVIPITPQCIDLPNLIERCHTQRAARAAVFHTHGTPPFLFFIESFSLSLVTISRDGTGISLRAEDHDGGRAADGHRAPGFCRGEPEAGRIAAALAGIATDVGAGAGSHGTETGPSASGSRCGI